MTTRTLISDFIIEARKGKGKSGDAGKRSRLLKAVMPAFSGDEGKALANALEAKDLDRFKTLWDKASNAIISKLEAEFRTGNKEKPKQKTAKERPDTSPELNKAPDVLLKNKKEVD